MDRRLAVIDRAQDREAIRQASHPGEVLADLEAGDVGADRPEGPADGVRGVGLKVPGVKLAGTTDKEELDTRLVPRRGSAEPFQLGQLGQAHPDSQAASPQEIASGQSVASADAAVAFEAEHGDSSRPQGQQEKAVAAEKGRSTP